MGLECALGPTGEILSTGKNPFVMVQIVRSRVPRN
jgi:hypothetical protein